MRIASSSLFLIIAACLSLALSSPVLLRSSSSLPELKNNYFLDSSELVQKLTANFNNKVDLPNAVYVFEINVRNSDLLRTGKQLMSELGRMKSLKAYFGDSERSFTSNYINYESAGDIRTRLFNRLYDVNQDYQEIATSLKDLINDQTSPKNKVLYVVSVGLEDLENLDLFLRQNFDNIEENKSLVCLLFNIKQSRILQVDQEEANAAGAQVAAGADQVAQEGEQEEEAADAEDGEAVEVVNLTANGLSGILVGFLVLIIFLVGLSCLCDIQSPPTFVKVPLILGKEDL